jgi:hypothetical protein
MELYTVIDMASGQILRGGGTEHAQAHPLEAGEGLYVGEALSARQWYFVDGLPVAYTEQELVVMAARPRYACHWDIATKTWADDRTAQDLQAAHAAAIEAERDRRLYASIDFQGKTIQARPVDQKNLSDKQWEMQQRAALGQPLPDQLRVWRALDNTLVPFADDAAYMAWLGGLTIALATRGTMAYAWSWAKKAALVALGDDLVGLKAFDPTA